MKKKRLITVIATGGTIDSEWNSSRDTVVPARKSILPEYFERIKPELKFEFVNVCMKDSRDLTPNDIKRICKAVDQAKGRKVLITHGTYTMPDTARYLESNMKTNKAVVLTGSAAPLRGYDMSDAGFNLGFAVAILLTLESGIRLVMNSKAFEPSEVAKNMAEGKFFSIKQ